MKGSRKYVKKISERETISQDRILQSNNMFIWCLSLARVNFLTIHESGPWRLKMGKSWKENNLAAEACLVEALGTVTLDPTFLLFSGI